MQKNNPKTQKVQLKSAQVGAIRKRSRKYILEVSSPISFDCRTDFSENQACEKEVIRAFSKKKSIGEKLFKAESQPY
jgi:hypothetical protein